MASEARLVVLGVTDSASIADIIWPAFQGALESPAEIAYTQEVVGSRVLARLRDRASGEEPPDVVTLLNPQPVIAAGLADQAAPSLRVRYPSAWTRSGYLWPLYVEPTVAIYNSHATAAPGAWADLASTAQGRLVFEAPWRMSTTGPALAELSGQLERGTWEALLRGLAATRPRLVKDNERAVLEVGMGRSWMGLSNLRFARRVRAESPVRHVLLDPAPCIPAFGLLVRGARHPKLARTFLEWLTSDAGQAAFLAAGRVPALPAHGIPAFRGLVGNREVRPLLGSVDWVAHASAWADRFRSMFPGGEVVRM